MEFNSGALRDAHGALRAYASTEDPKQFEPAHAALSTLVVTAQRRGDSAMAAELIEARNMLNYGPQGATDAEAVLDRIETR
ncbi:hypothetical protein ACFOYW_13370 [Gryllotalpicola reticulitermitis]|uniref:Uncharacterized protein n=1 Tax=Gryllotalpicola reticulitermitis TaxID=1184153 RepID=A0ABV8QAN6_9MICO